MTMEHSRLSPAGVACTALIVFLIVALPALANGWENRGIIDDGYDPKIAAEDDFVHVVYCPWPLGNGLEYRRSTDGGDSWGAPLTIATGIGSDVADPQIEVFQGTVHVVWCRSS